MNRVQQRCAVNKIDKDILARLKKSLTACFNQLQNEPIILIDTKGKRWVNSLAAKIIRQRGLFTEDFTEWIKVGSTHLQDIAYRDVCVHMCRLHNNEVVAFLKTECENTWKTKEVKLTGKQKEILRYVLDGFSNKEIANKMIISPATVNTHLDNIYLKLGCSSRIEASLCP